MARYEKPDMRIDPKDHGMPENLPNKLQVPDFNILVITESDAERDIYDQVVEPLRGKVKRDWFVQHAYHCLPLTMANQLGFIVKALYSFEVVWNGGDSTTDVSVTPILTEDEEAANITTRQLISSHFGMGTFTVQNRWHYRTSPGINLMTIAPPNYFIDGISHMNGMIETDNLRRDFTFNLRITRPNTPVRINRGDPIGCLLPYPRNFFDQFAMHLAEDVTSSTRVKEERSAAHLAGRERATIDAKYKGGIGLRYMEGEDSFGNRFADHQKTLHKPEEAARRYRTGPHAQQTAHAEQARQDAGLLHMQNVLPADACKLLCATWEELQTLTSDESRTVPFFDRRVLHYQDVLREQPLAAAYMKLAIDLVRERLKSHFNCGELWADDIQLVKWWQGHRMPPHADRENPDGSPHSTPWREYASVVYLNDDYEGGRIEFPNLGTIAAPKAGDLICFRGDLSHLHGVQEVLAGERYTMPAWYTSDPARRSRCLYPESG